MENELIREQMINLSYDLSDIKTELDNVILEYDEIVIAMKKNLLIDEKIIEEENIHSYKNDLVKVNQEITNGVISRINNQYY